MNAYTNDFAQATAPATADTIANLVRKMAEVNGGAFIPNTTAYSPTLRAYALELVEALGATPEQASALRDHELTAFYSVSRKNPEAGKRLALKQFKAATAPATPAPMPIPSAMSPEALAALVSQITDNARATTLNILATYENDLPGMVAAELSKIIPRKVEFHIPELPPITVDHAHKVFPRILRKALKRRNVYLVGGMGTGKTTIGKQLAKVLNLSFYMASSVFEEHKLFGYCDASGRYVTTDFRRAFEFGGVFLFDELDRSDPSVVTSFNAALANGFAAFPDALVQRHPDCVLIAAGNTALRGANREFNAAQKQDSSVLDRFCVIPVELDLELEQALCINPDWLAYCRALRLAASVQAIDLAVTPRASIEGAQAIAEGDSWEEAADGYIWKGLADNDRKRLEGMVSLDEYATAGGII
jgi:hypothetical protein